MKHVILKSRNLPFTLMLFLSTVYMELFISDNSRAEATELMAWVCPVVKVMVKLTTTLPGEKLLISILSWPESTMALISGERDW